MAKKLNIAPMSKPRMTRADAWKGRSVVERYWAFKDELKGLWGNTDLPPRFRIVFNVAMPASWPEVSKANPDKCKSLLDGEPHQQKPDIDNFIKAFMDSLCEDDSYVFEVHAQKFWAREGSIEFEEIK